MRRVKWFRTAFFFTWIAAGAGFLTGCQPVLGGKVSGSIPQEVRIALEPASQSRAWETPDLTVSYQTERNGDNLKLSGVVKLSDRMQSNFLLIHYFHLDVIFADDTGRVLEMRGLTSAAPGHSEEPMDFSNALKLPEKTVSMAFSYRGEARTGSDDGGNTNYFWFYPIHR